MASQFLARPFAALRPTAETAADVIAPPYDVLSTDEARALAATRPASFLHISRPEVDLPPGSSPYSDAAYERGAENLARLRAGGVLMRDREPSFYVYRMVMNGRAQAGVAFAASVAAYQANRIRRHERTRPDKENDRVRNIATLNAQTGPVLLAYRANAALAELIDAAAAAKALFSVPGPNDIGYTRYVAQGGDWGAFVVDQMGLQAPAGLLAIHTNMPATVPADVDRALQLGDPPPSGVSAEERRAYEQLVRTFKQVEYARMMAARPQTLYGIADSPVGLAAWLLDHNDADGQPAAAVVSALDRTTSATGELTRDEILDNITLYWLTNTGVSASRLYWEYRGGFFNAKGVKIPVAVSVFPGEQYQAPRSWAEQAYPNLIYFNEVDKGGHFAAWEQPQLFTEELRAAFRSLR